MSNDRYQEIRKALAMGPMAGPWSEYANHRRRPYIAGADGSLIAFIESDDDVEDANAAHIAACDPDTIRTLLTERDQLAAALEAAREDAERYRWLRKGASDEVAVVRGLGAMDYGMSAVVSTYSEEIDGDDLDAAIDQARGKGGCGEGVKNANG